MNKIPLGFLEENAWDSEKEFRDADLKDDQQQFDLPPDWPLPLTTKDVDALPPMCMDMPLADPCPKCGGHNMVLGDWVCWRSCRGCSEEFQAYLESRRRSE